MSNEDREIVRICEKSYQEYLEGKCSPIDEVFARTEKELKEEGV